MSPLIPRTVRIVTICTCITLFAMLLLQPALRIGTWPPEPSSSYLLVGWLGPLAGHFEWYANLLLVWACFTLGAGRSTTTIIVSICAFALMMETPFRGCIVRDEGGHCQAITEFMIGWRLLASIPFVLLIGGLMNILFNRKMAHV
jgi:hypothetical protein